MCAVTFGSDLGPLSKILPYKGLKLYTTMYFLKAVIKLEMWGHGIGRHCLPDIVSIGLSDLVSVSKFLGAKL